MNIRLSLFAATICLAMIVSAADRPNVILVMTRKEMLDYLEHRRWRRR